MPPTSPFACKQTGFDLAHVAENLAHDPTLPLHTGVTPVRVDAALAHQCADFLHSRWGFQGHLTLPSGTRVHGFTTYKQVSQTHDAAKQRQHTLAFAGPLLDSARAEVPGFAAMEAFLVGYLGSTLGTPHVLSHAHALRQGPRTQMATGFLSHQDLDVSELIEQSIVVKLTADLPRESPSHMVVAAAARPFAYAPHAGAAAHFDARLWHASVPPTSDREHLKLTFFFRPATRRELRAQKRPA